MCYLIFKCPCHAAGCERMLCFTSPLVVQHDVILRKHADPDAGGLDSACLLLTRTICSMVRISAAASMLASKRCS
jgi:hypothetical protein